MMVYKSGHLTIKRVLFVINVSEFMRNQDADGDGILLRVIIQIFKILWESLRAGFRNLWF